jgi:hypothetical protein
LPRKGLTLTHSRNYELIDTTMIWNIPGRPYRHLPIYVVPLTWNVPSLPPDEYFSENVKCGLLKLPQERPICFSFIQKMVRKTNVLSSSSKKSKLRETERERHTNIYSSIRVAINLCQSIFANSTSSFALNVWN